MKNKIDEIMERFKSPIDGEISVYSMADYIFELERKLQNTSSNSDYAKLPNIDELKSYMHRHKYLPNIVGTLEAIKKLGNSS